MAKKYMDMSEREKLLFLSRILDMLLAKDKATLKKVIGDMGLRVDIHEGDEGMGEFDELEESTFKEVNEFMYYGQFNKGKAMELREKVNKRMLERIDAQAAEEVEGGALGRLREAVDWLAAGNWVRAKGLAEGLNAKDLTDEVTSFEGEDEAYKAVLEKNRDSIFKGFEGILKVILEGEGGSATKVLEVNKKLFDTIERIQEQADEEGLASTTVPREGLDDEGGKADEGGRAPSHWSIEESGEPGVLESDFDESVAREEAIELGLDSKSSEGAQDVERQLEAAVRKVEEATELLEGEGPGK